MMSRLHGLARSALSLIAMCLVGAVPLVAQQTASALSGQSLRPYHFVFLAFALAWILVLGWVVSIGRRVSRLAERLGE